MPAKNQDLHGNVPEQSPIALLLIDVINDLEFPGGEELYPSARRAADAIAALKTRARSIGIPAIYVNDNFGRWRSDLRVLVEHCLGDVRGRPIVERLRPAKDDYFVLKPKHSAFFSTTLETLLAYLRVETLILTGFTADTCVLFTASDAFMRDFHIVVPSDCVAACTDEEHAASLRQMEKLLKTSTRPSSELDLSKLHRHAMRPDQTARPFSLASSNSIAGTGVNG